MAVDLSVFGNLKTMGDYQRAEEEFQLKKQLQQAQIYEALNKGNEFDLDKMGEKILVKASMGQELSPQEQAIGRAYDAKRNQVFVDPSGNLVRKPPAFGNLAIPASVNDVPGLQDISSSQQMAELVGQPEAIGSGVIADAPGVGEYVQNVKKQLAAAQNNPKLKQTILETYAKDVISPNDTALKNAGFADRMAQSNPNIDKFQDAGKSWWENTKASVPLIGNYLVSGDYQNFEQAQRDFINAQLRRESGAVISPGEFANAERQYFPQPGDQEAALELKRKNREAALKAMQRSAGPSYKPPEVAQDPYKKAEREFNQRKAAQKAATVESLINKYAD